MTTTLARPNNSQANNSQANGSGIQADANTQIAPRGPALPAQPNLLITDEHRQILKAMIDRNATPAQVEMLIVVGNRYDLDPLMGHVVLINGKCFVTHKGLMHKAHASGVFDGIRHGFGVDELGEYCECQVWRKDMSRPFDGRIYVDEYRSAGPVWKQYPRAMAAKTAESFVLRRAFDVSLTSQEEMSVADAPPPRRVYTPQEVAERKALSERITAAMKALNVEQFEAFRSDAAEQGGLPAMETAGIRDFLARVEAVAEANAAQAEADRAESERVQAEAAQATPPRPPATQPKAPAAGARGIDAADEDDPFAEE